MASPGLCGPDGRNYAITDSVGTAWEHQLTAAEAIAIAPKLALEKGEAVYIWDHGGSELPTKVVPNRHVYLVDQVRALGLSPEGLAAFMSAAS